VAKNIFFGVDSRLKIKKKIEEKDGQEAGRRDREMRNKHQINKSSNHPINSVTCFDMTAS
jgi:hypothetical protein